MKKIADSEKYLLFAQGSTLGFDSVSNHDSFDLHTFDHKNQILSPLAGRLFQGLAFDREADHCIYETDLGIEKISDYYISPLSNSGTLVLRCSLSSDYDSKFYFIVTPAGEFITLQLERGKYALKTKSFTPEHQR